MNNEDRERLISSMGRNQLVRDLEAVHRRIHDAHVRGGVQAARTVADAQRQAGEVKTFLDDVQEITGLTPESPMFWNYVWLTLARRLARVEQRSEERAMRRDLMDGFEGGEPWPEGW